MYGYFGDSMGTAFLVASVHIQRSLNMICIWFISDDINENFNYGDQGDNSS